MWDALWLDARIVTMRDGRYNSIERGAIAVEAGLIVWLGPRDGLPGEAARLAREVHDLRGAMLTPGLIDCHTHLVFAGNRAREFELRLQGASDADIARAGGGIISTVEATRDASDTELVSGAARRLRRLMDEGVTSVEIKSGYGLDTRTEL